MNGATLQAEVLNILTEHLCNFNTCSKITQGMEIDCIWLHFQDKFDYPRAAHRIEMNINC